MAPPRRAVAERLLALVTPEPALAAVVRRAWRSAQRLAAELDILSCARPAGASAEEREQLEALRRLAACSARACSSRRATTSPRSPGASRASAAPPTS